jgi:hypothetical protein
LQPHLDQRLIRGSSVLHTHRPLDHLPHGRYVLERIPENPIYEYPIDRIEELPLWNILAKLPSLTTRSS